MAKLTSERVAILGPPLSGKTVQSRLVSKEFGLQHISTGDIFRQEMQAKSILGLKIYDLMAAGSLVPDEIVLRVIQTYLKTVEDKYLLDGFPRTVGQARFLDTYLTSNRAKLDRLIVLNVPDDVVFARATKRKREEKRVEDASRDVLQKRLCLYRDQTMKAIDFFDRLGAVSYVDGTQRMDDVFAD